MVALDGIELGEDLAGGIDIGKDALDAREGMDRSEDVAVQF